MCHAQNTITLRQVVQEEIFKGFFLIKLHNTRADYDVIPGTHLNLIAL